MKAQTSYCNTLTSQAECIIKLRREGFVHIEPERVSGRRVNASSALRCAFPAPLLTTQLTLFNTEYEAETNSAIFIPLGCIEKSWNDSLTREVTFIPRMEKSVLGVEDEEN